MRDSADTNPEVTPTQKADAAVLELEKKALKFSKIASVDNEALLQAIQRADDEVKKKKGVPETKGETEPPLPQQPTPSSPSPLAPLVFVQISEETDDQSVVDLSTNYKILAIQAAKAALKLYQMESTEAVNTSPPIDNALKHFRKKIEELIPGDADANLKHLKRNLKKMNELYAEYCLTLANCVRENLRLPPSSLKQLHKDLLHITHFLSWQYPARATVHISLVNSISSDAPLLIVRHMKPLTQLTQTQKKLLVEAKKTPPKQQPAWLRHLTDIKRRLILEAIPPDINGDWRAFEQNVLPAQARDIPLLANHVHMTTRTYRQKEVRNEYELIDTSCVTSHSVPVPYEMKDKGERLAHTKLNIYQQLIFQLESYCKNKGLPIDDQSPEESDAAYLNRLAVSALQHFNREWNCSLNRLPLSILSLLDDGGALARSLPGEAGQGARSLATERQAMQEIANELKQYPLTLSLHNVSVHRIGVITEAFNDLDDSNPTAGFNGGFYNAQNAEAALAYFQHVYERINGSRNPIEKSPPLLNQYQQVLNALKATFDTAYTSDTALSQNLNLLRAAYIDLLQRLLETGSLHCKSAKDRVSAVDNMAAAINHFALVHGLKNPDVTNNPYPHLSSDVTKLLCYFQHFKRESARAMVAHRNQLGVMGEKDGSRSLMSGMQEIIPKSMRTDISRAFLEGTLLAKNNKPKLHARTPTKLKAAAALCGPLCVPLVLSIVVGAIGGAYHGARLGIRSAKSLCYTPKHQIVSAALTGVVGLMLGAIGLIVGAVAGALAGPALAGHALTQHFSKKERIAAAANEQLEFQTSLKKQATQSLPTIIAASALSPPRVVSSNRSLTSNPTPDLRRLHSPRAETTETGGMFRRGKGIENSAGSVDSRQPLLSEQSNSSAPKLIP